MTTESEQMLKDIKDRKRESKISTCRAIPRKHCENQIRVTFSELLDTDECSDLIEAMIRDIAKINRKLDEIEWKQVFG